MWLWIERRSADPGRGFRYPSVIAVAAPTCEAALAAGKARRGRRRDRGEEYVTSATTGTAAAAWFAERGARTEALRAELPRAAVLAAFDDDGPVETTADAGVGPRNETGEGVRTERVRTDPHRATGSSGGRRRLTPSSTRWSGT